jgi:hypothetical protein
MPHKSTLFIIIAVATLFAGVFAEPAAVDTLSESSAVGQTTGNSPDSAINTAAAPDSVAEAVETEAPSVGEPEPADSAYVPPVPTAHTKYIAVVETDVDEHSGAAVELSRADVRLVTAELRRGAGLT